MNEVKDAIKAILEPRPVEAPRINTPPASSAAPVTRNARQTQTMGRALAPAATPASTTTVGRPRVDAARQTTDPIERAQTAAVERAQVAAVAEKLREILLRKLADNTLQLPSLPAVAFKCLELLRRPETSFRELGAVLENDPLITARLLRVVNSSLYGARGTINSVETAVSRLGMKSLTTLLQEMSAEQVFASRDPRIRSAFKGVWDHCLAVAHLSRAIAAAVADKPGAVDGDTAYMAGLVHDIGKPIVAVVMLEAERMLLAEAGGTWVNGNVWVASVNGCHREVGASLAAKWELPAAIVDSILRLGSYDEELPMGCRNVVRFAHALAVREGWGASPTFDADEILRVIMQGRALLQLNESVEDSAIGGLRGKLDAVTSVATERR
jgi:putative nucleotidyltransferase with HDIG domain